MKRRLNEIYVRHTGQDYATIEKTLDRDYFLSAEDARTFGIVDEVITKRDPLDEKIQKLMPCPSRAALGKPVTKAFISRRSSCRLG